MKDFFKKIKAASESLAFWRKRKAAEPQPDQSVIIEKPSAEELAAVAAPAPEKRGLIARFKSLFRRQAKPVAADAESQAATESAAVDDQKSRTQTTDAETSNAEEAETKPALKQRVLAVLSKKKVWIPALGVLLLTLIGGSVALLTRHSAHETAALQAELEKTKKELKKQLQHQAAQPKTQAQVEAETARLAANQSGSVAVRPSPENKPGREPGDCVITTKESVAASLRDCIEGFNRGNNKPTKKAP